MKKLLSTNYTDWSFNVALFFLRAGSGILMLMHGYSKLIRFSEMKNTFINFMHLGSTVSLSLDIFAEFFCSIFLIIGLFSRFVVIPLIIAMSVALIKAHHWDVFGDGEKASLFLLCFITILLIGPGKVSVDGAMGK